MMSVGACWAALASLPSVGESKTGLPLVIRSAAASNSDNVGGVEYIQPLTSTVGVPLNWSLSAKIDPRVILATDAESIRQRAKRAESATPAAAANAPQGFRPNESCCANSRLRRS